MTPAQRSRANFSARIAVFYLPAIAIVGFIVFAVHVAATICARR